uniref:Cinnamoyl-CoA reductase 2 n=1 Tax=Rhizophora mucronata TaxID=61149 RepID=A0A2P2K6D0_RHIMU
MCRYREMVEMVFSEPLVRPRFTEKGNHCNGQAFSIGCLSVGENRLVCVTSGNSYLGSHMVKQLLAHGYLVRVTIQNPVDYEDMRRLIEDEDMNKLENVVVAKMQDLDSLCNAFSGCHAVFHTSSFIDPHGITGYSQQTAILEADAAQNVMEACGSAENVKRCIFTSSLLASIWIAQNPNRVIDEGCWSNEEFCRDRKLWLALGKTVAEKAAWRKSKELKLKLVTICPGLLMAPSFPRAHKESSVPYLKGNYFHPISAVFPRV